MKAASLAEVLERSALCDTHALVTGQTKRLLLVAARAARAVLPRRERVHGKKVVWMNVARSHAPVVAIGARLLAMAVATETTVVSGNQLVPSQPIRPVL
jgi:hypothetical protein